MVKSPTVDVEGNFCHPGGSEWNPYWKSSRTEDTRPDYDRMIIELLMHEELFSGTCGNGRLFLLVNCNDIFTWGSSDCEDIDRNDVPVLYDMWKTDHVWGSAKWCALKRQQRPQEPVVKRMKEAGVWDEQMEALGKNNE